MKQCDVMSHPPTNMISEDTYPHHLFLSLLLLIYLLNPSILSSTFVNLHMQSFSQLSPSDIPACDVKQRPSMYEQLSFGLIPSSSSSPSLAQPLYLSFCRCCSLLQAKLSFFQSCFPCPHQPPCIMLEGLDAVVEDLAATLLWVLQLCTAYGHYKGSCNRILVSRD